MQLFLTYEKVKKDGRPETILFDLAILLLRIDKFENMYTTTPDVSAVLIEGGGLSLFPPF